MEKSILEMDRYIMLEQDMYDEIGCVILKGGETYLITSETEDAYYVFQDKIDKNGDIKYRIIYDWCSFV